MDNVCHTLVGLAVARAGLNRTTRLATATLAISANLPDIDVLVFAADIPSVSFRRGWTHGPIAQLLLPLLCAGVMWQLARRRTEHRSESPPGSTRASVWWLLALSFIGIYTHVFLDYLNNYGVRLLMPFSHRWFYGDAVFIVDIWLWLMLGLGWWRSRGGDTRPARLGLAAASIYIALMLISARSARSIIAGKWMEVTGGLPAHLMVGPVPVNPFRKDIIIDAGDHYVTGRFDWLPRRVIFDPGQIAKNAQQPAVAAAQTDPRVRGILVWSRFPFWTLRAAPDGVEVTLSDVRFARMGRAGFAATTIVRQP